MSAAKTAPKPLPDEHTAALVAALRWYINEYPAFRTKPVGAPNSPARREQDRRIANEDSAITAIQAVREVAKIP